MIDCKPYITTTKINLTLEDQRLILDITVENNIMDQYYQEIVDFKEKTVREALIKLGWTPPKEAHDDKRT